MQPHIGATVFVRGDWREIGTVLKMSGKVGVECCIVEWSPGFESSQWANSLVTIKAR